MILCFGLTKGKYIYHTPRKGTQRPSNTSSFHHYKLHPDQISVFRFEQRCSHRDMIRDKCISFFYYVQIICLHFFFFFFCKAGYWLLHMVRYGVKSPCWLKHLHNASDKMENIMYHCGGLFRQSDGLSPTQTGIYTNPNHLRSTQRTYNSCAEKPRIQLVCCCSCCKSKH